MSYPYFGRTFLPASLLLASILTACERNTAEVEPVQCTGTSASAAGRIVVRFQEQLAATGATPALTCQDEIYHPCTNYHLLQTVSSTSNSLSVNFTGIDNPTICLTSPALAHSLVDLSSLALGTYGVSWQAGGKQTTGTLLIAADRVEVTSCDTNTVAVRNPVTYRIPATTLWGQSYARTPAAQTAMAAVLDSLRKEGAVPITLPTGHYGHFRVDAKGQLIPLSASQKGQPATAVVTPLLLSYS
ncbi:MAG: hypothetical protein EOO62_09060, partial [Hymenobacter sp.]